MLIGWWIAVVGVVVTQPARRASKGMIEKVFFMMSFVHEGRIRCC
jgi:hypothetical protein